ncbi:root hair defective 3-like protein [Tanacetum coccineum]
MVALNLIVTISVGGLDATSKLKDTLYGPVEALLEGAAEDTWPAIRKVLRNETKTVVFEFTDALSGYEMDEDAKKNHISTLENYAIDVVEGKTKEEASKVLQRMKERFTIIFNHDNYLMPRTWTGKEDIRAINKIARTSSLKLLSVLVAIRLEDYSDKIEGMLLLALAEPNKGPENSSNLQDPLATSKWDKKETEYAVSQAISAQKANKQNGNWLPPPWAIAALLESIIPIIYLCRLPAFESIVGSARLRF